MPVSCTGRKSICWSAAQVENQYAGQLHMYSLLTENCKNQIEIVSEKGFLEPLVYFPGKKAKLLEANQFTMFGFSIHNQMHFR